MTIMRLAIVLSVLAALAGCGGYAGGPHFVNAEAAPTRTMTVALLPFENLSSDPNAGQIVAQMFASELYARNLFRLIEETEARKRATDARIDLNLLGEKATAGQAAAALNVDAILLGSVAEYRYQHGLKEEPSVGLSARLVRRDGTVLWATSQATVGGGVLQRGSLSATAQDLVSTMVQALAGASR